mgnify:FL=1
MKFECKFVERLMLDKTINFRFVKTTDVLFSSGEEAGEESIGCVARVAENTEHPLEIVLTTQGNYKLYGKSGAMLKFLEKKYYTMNEIITWIKRI